MAKAVLETLYHFSGAAFGYTALVESDFTAASGLAYTPPERGSYRRIVALRSIQLLQDTTRLIHTYQTSAVILRLPSNQIGSDESGNDAGNGRDIWVNNKGTGTVTIQDSAGTVLHVLAAGLKLICHSGINQEWDIYLKSENIFFSAVGFISNNVRDAIIEAKSYLTDFSRTAITLTSNGTVANGGFVYLSELLSNTRIPFPLKYTLREISWNNVNTALGAFTWEFYKNGTAIGNLIYTYTPTALERTNGIGNHIFTGVVTLNAGDFLYIKNVRPSGTALTDLGAILWVSRTP